MNVKLILKKYVQRRIRHFLKFYFLSCISYILEQFVLKKITLDLGKSGTYGGLALRLAIWEIFV